MKFDEANKENSIMTSTTIQLPINRIIKNIHIYTLLNTILKPPPAYTFSQRQHKQQFHLMIHMTEPIVPFTTNVALYNMAIVAVRKSYIIILH
jgi:hypothetical protein